MSDTPQDTPPPGIPDAAGTPPGGVPLRFLAQFIKDLSFEAPNAPEIFNVMRQEGQGPEMTVTIDATVRQVEGPVFEVSLSVQLEARSGDKVAFILELIFNTIVEIDPQAVPPEYVHSLLLIEVPRHSFPFARQIVAETTANGGFPPLMLQVVDFAELYRRKFVDGQNAEQTGEQAAQPPAPSVH